jgi:hypothetical protein
MLLTDREEVVTVAEKVKPATPKQVSFVMRGAVMVLVERAGGFVEFTDTELAAIRARRGPYIATAMVDRSKPGEPIIRVALEPAPGAPSDPVM